LALVHTRFYTGRAFQGRDALPAGVQYCSRCQRTYGADQPFCPLDGVALRPIPEEFPTPGAVVNGRYLVRSRLADGGMGTVFRATDLRGRREVALKILKPALAAKEAAVGRFFIEAQAAGRLRHPNVVEMFDFGVSREGWLYLSMEFLPGETLADRIGREGRLSVGDAVLVCLGIADALAHAHAHGVVHRDMKPENVVLVDWDCEGAFVKVLDFGIAAIADSPVRGALHRGEVLGTPAYMSPEQVRGDVVDPRSDLYSLGVLLHEALAGSPPFPGLSAAEVMRQHLAEAPPSLPALAVPPRPGRDWRPSWRTSCARTPPTVPRRPSPSGSGCAGSWTPWRWIVRGPWTRASWGRSWRRCEPWSPSTNVPRWKSFRSARRAMEDSTIGRRCSSARVAWRWR
jgi:serine/threonine protein kinase